MIIESLTPPNIGEALAIINGWSQMHANALRVNRDWMLGKRLPMVYVPRFFSFNYSILNIEMFRARHFHIANVIICVYMIHAFSTLCFCYSRLPFSSRLGFDFQTHFSLELQVNFGCTCASDLRTRCCTVPTFETTPSIPKHQTTRKHFISSIATPHTFLDMSI